MKTKLIISFLIGIVTLAFASCSLDENLSSQKEFNEDEFASTVKFLPISEIYTRSPTIPPNKKTTGIIKARIARASRGCNRGFGLCDFKLFPKNSEIYLEQSLEANEALFEVRQDEITGEYIADMLLANPLPDNVSSDLIPIRIDNNLFWINDQETKAELNEVINMAYDKQAMIEDCNTGLFAKEAYEILNGEIKFDTSLGINGGYEVKLAPIDDN